MLRYLTAGESHGPALVAILEGMPDPRDLRRAEHDGTEVKKLLSSFDKQSRRLRTQIEKMEVQSASQGTQVRAVAQERPAIRAAKKK